MIPKLNSCVASEMSNTHLKLYGKEQRGTKDMICHPSINLRYRHYEWQYPNHTLQIESDWMYNYVAVYRFDLSLKTKKL